MKASPNQERAIERLNPLAFKDYRSFLLAHVQAKKAANPSWSYTVWARQLGLKSSSTLIMILNGQRNPGRGLLADFSRYFKFSDSEKQYFADLVRLAKAHSDVQLSMAVMKQLEERNPGKGFRMLDQDTFLAISQWHYLALREMVQLREFREDPEWIAAQLQFPVKPEKIAEALQTLIRLNLITRNAQGRLEATASHLDTTNDISNEGLKRHHEQQLAHASQTLRSLAPETREISGGCFAIKAESLPRAKEMMRSFAVQLCNELEAKDGDQVFQLMLAFFPLSKIIKEGIQ
ncbi:MAG: TIGR02147 family protein [Bdellovibrionota bacterium]